MENLTKNDDNENKEETYRDEDGGESSSVTGMSFSNNNYAGNDSNQEEQNYEDNNVISRATSSTYSILSLLPSFLHNNNHEQEQNTTVQTFTSRRRLATSRVSEEKQKNSPNNSNSTLMQELNEISKRTNTSRNKKLPHSFKDQQQQDFSSLATLSNMLLQPLARNDQNKVTPTEEKNEEKEWDEEGSFVSFDSQSSSTKDTTTTNTNVSTSSKNYTSDNEEEHNSITSKEHSDKNKQNTEDELSKQKEKMQQNDYILQRQQEQTAEIVISSQSTSQENVMDFLVSRWKQTQFFSAKAMNATNITRNDGLLPPKLPTDDIDVSTNMFPPLHERNKNALQENRLDDLLSLGLGLSAHGMGRNLNDVMFSDNDTAEQSNKSSLQVTNEQNLDTIPEQAWWIQDLKDRDCFGHDTNTLAPFLQEIQLKDSIKETRIQPTEDHYGADKFAIDDGNQGENYDTSDGLSPYDNSAQEQNTAQASSNNKLENDVNTDDTVNDIPNNDPLEERLWLAARIYYKVNIDVEKTNQTEDGGIYNIDVEDASEIMEFRSLMQTCLWIYIQLFHTFPAIIMTPTDNLSGRADIDCDDSSSSKSSSDKISIQTQKKEVSLSFNENQTTMISYDNSRIIRFQGCSETSASAKDDLDLLLEEDTQPYVPLSVVHTLFEKIIYSYFNLKIKKNDDSESEDVSVEKSEEAPVREQSKSLLGSISRENDTPEDQIENKTDDENKRDLKSRKHQSSDFTDVDLQLKEENIERENQVTKEDIANAAIQDHHRNLVHMLLKALLSPEMNIFRQYEVNVFENVDSDEIDITNEDLDEGDENIIQTSQETKNHRFVREELDRQNHTQAMKKKELDRFLYGDDDYVDDSDSDSGNETDDSVQNEDQDTDINTSGQNFDLESSQDLRRNVLDSHGKRDRIDDKKEIRLRDDVIDQILNNQNLLAPPEDLSDNLKETIEKIKRENEWNSIFASHILFGSILCQKDMNGNIENSTWKDYFEISRDSSKDNGIHQINAKGIDCEPLLSELYALKVIPQFLMRSMVAYIISSNPISWTSKESSENKREKPGVLKGKYSIFPRNLLLDKDFLCSRSFSFGPFDTTISTLREWESFNSLSKAISEKMISPENDCTLLWGESDSESLSFSNLFDSLLAALTHILHEVTKEDSTEIKAKLKQTFSPTSDMKSAPQVIASLLDSGYDNSMTIHRPRVVSCCIEIGRSLHHLGISLGRKPQQLEANKKQMDTIKLELSAYEKSIQAYRDSLSFLTTTELSLSSTLDSSKYALEINPKNENEKCREKKIQLRLENTRDAKSSTQLHLADVLSAVGYCHDAKLSDYKNSLSFYKEAEKYYSDHVGREHITIANVLQNLGTIYFELRDWSHAITCFKERVSILEKLIDKGKTSHSEEKSTSKERSPRTSELSETSSFGKIDSLIEELSYTLHSLGTVYSELNDGHNAIHYNFESIRVMRDSSAGQRKNKAAIDTHKIFISQVLSEIGSLQIIASSNSLSTWYSQHYKLLYASKLVDFPSERDDGSLISQLAHKEWSAINSLEESIQLRIGQKGRICNELEKISSVVSSYGLLRLDDFKQKRIDTKNDLRQTDHLEPFVAKIEFDEDVESVYEQSFLELATNDDLEKLSKDLLRLGSLKFRQKGYEASAHDLTDALILLIYVASGSVESIQSILSDDNHDQNSLSFLLLRFKYLPVTLLSLLSSALARLKDFEKGIRCLTVALSIMENGAKVIEEQEDDLKVKLSLSYLIAMARLHHKTGSMYYEMKNYETSISHFRSALRLYDKASDEVESDENEEEVHLSDPIVDYNSGYNDDTYHTDIPGFNHAEKQQRLRNINVKNGLALLLHSLGKAYYKTHKKSKAQTCFEDVVEILDSDDQTLLALIDAEDFATPEMDFLGASVTKSLDVNEIFLPPTVIMLALGDSYRRIGKSYLKENLEHEALLSFERSIEIYEYFNSSSISPINRDDESSFVHLVAGRYNTDLMECYECGLDLSEKHKSDDDFHFMNQSSFFGLGVYHNNFTDNENDFRLTKEDILFRMGNLYARSNRFTEALNCYNEAKKLTVAKLCSEDHIIVANLAHNIGKVFKDIFTSSIDLIDTTGYDAIQYFEDSVKIATKILGSNHLFVADSKYNSAIVLEKISVMCENLEKKEKHEKMALKYLEESIQIMTSNFGELHVDLVDALFLMGKLYMKKDIDKTLLILEKVYNDRKLLYGPQHLQVATALKYLGKAYMVKASYEYRKDKTKNSHISYLQSSMKYLVSSFEIFQKEIKNDISPGINDTSLSTIDDEGHNGKRNLAQVKLYLDTAKVMSDISLLKQALGDTNNSKLLLRDTLQFLHCNISKIKIEGNKNHSYREVVGTAWGILAEINFLDGNLSNSIEFYKESLDLTESELGDPFFEFQYSNRLLSLGAAYSRDNQPEKSLRCYAVCLSSFLLDYGDESIEVASIFQLMGREHAMLGDQLNSLKCYEASLRVHSSITSPESNRSFHKAMKAILHQHYAEFISLHKLGSDTEAYENYNVAATLIEEVRGQQMTTEDVILFKENSIQSEIYRIVLSIDSWEKRLMICYSSLLKLTNVLFGEHNDIEEVADIFHRIGNIYTAFEQYDKAMLCFFKVLHFQRITNGDDNLSVADLLFNIGNIYIKKGDMSKALECHEECYRISIKVLGKDNIELLEHLQYLQSISYQLSQYKDSIFWCQKALHIIRLDSGNKEALYLTLHQLVSNTF